MASKVKAVGQIPLASAAAQQLTQLKGLSGETILLGNLSATNPMFIGVDSGVTAANGWRIPAGQALSLDILNGSGLWVIGTAADILNYMVLSP
jgi:hypothetical protein